LKDNFYPNHIIINQNKQAFFIKFSKNRAIFSVKQSFSKGVPFEGQENLRNEI